jgi:preprotein translocase subunit SecF
MKLYVNRQRSLWWIISSTILLSGLVAMLISWQQIGSPLRLGLDFVGGTGLQFARDCTVPNNCTAPIDISAVREVMDDQGLGSSSIQIAGQDRQAISLRTKFLDVNQRTQLQTALQEKIGTLDPKKTQIATVGPTLGQQLLNSGLLALLLSFAGIIVYLSLRFKFDYAFFAIVALFHDVWLTAGVFSILGLVQGVEIDSLFIVALLTIIGFSVNDTVVIYDRVRETLNQNPNRPIGDIVDDAVTQTLGRSINTTMTTLLTLVCIFLFGGETLKYFALALIIGFTTGAYSSIFIASTLLAWWRERSGQASVIPATDPKPSDEV